MADRRDVIGGGKANAEETRNYRYAASLRSALMGWSDKQSHILTGGGVSSELYQAPRFPFSEEELPHFHKGRGTTHKAFAAWRRQGTKFGTAIAGAWRRPLFVGGWTHSDDVSHDGETTFNLQTPSIFLDMRVPKAGSALLGHHRGFETMTDLELRLFARRHAFAGFTRVEPIIGGGSGGGGGGLMATRHHAIDWNFVGEPRPRPNKWRVETEPGGDIWREWGFAKDAFDQHVYMERWQRLPAGAGPFLALRRRPVASLPRTPDALLVVCGDHFGLIVDRRSPEVLLGKEPWGDSRAGGVAGVVDAAIARGDRRQAVDFLSLEASHGRVNRATGKEGYLPWTVDCSLHPWLQGRRPFLGTVLTVAPDSLSITLKVNREEDGGRFREQDGDNSAWTGVPLDGVWDVVESTLSRATGDAAAQPTLDTLFEGSGACVVKGDGRNEQGGPEDLWRKEGLMGRAKL